jgi:hypothetical protein
MKGKRIVSGALLSTLMRKEVVSIYPVAFSHLRLSLNYVSIIFYLAPQARFTKNL